MKKLIMILTMIESLFLLSCNKSPAEEFIAKMNDAKERLSSVNSSDGLSKIEDEVSALLEEEKNQTDKHYTHEEDSLTRKAFRDYCLEKERLFGVDDPSFHFIINYQDLIEKMQNVKSQQEYNSLKERASVLSDEFSALYDKHPDMYSEEVWTTLIGYQYSYLKAASNSPFSDYRFKIDDEGDGYKVSFDN